MCHYQCVTGGNTHINILMSKNTDLNVCVYLFIFYVLLLLLLLSLKQNQPNLINKMNAVSGRGRQWAAELQAGRRSTESPERLKHSPPSAALDQTHPQIRDRHRRVQVRPLQFDVTQSRTRNTWELPARWSGCGSVWRRRSVVDWLVRCNGLSFVRLEITGPCGRTETRTDQLLIHISIDNQSIVDV